MIEELLQRIDALENDALRPKVEDLTARIDKCEELLASLLALAISGKMPPGLEALKDALIPKKPATLRGRR